MARKYTSKSEADSAHPGKRLVRVSDYAHEIGASDQAVRAQISRGGLAAVRVFDGQGRPAVYVVAPMTSEAPGEALSAMEKAKLAKAQADAELRQIEVRKRRGELVELSEVVATITELLSEATNQFRHVGATCYPLDHAQAKRVQDVVDGVCVSVEAAVARIANEAKEK